MSDLLQLGRQSKLLETPKTCGASSFVAEAAEACALMPVRLSNASPDTPLLLEAITAETEGLSEQAVEGRTQLQILVFPLAVNIELEISR